MKPVVHFCTYANEEPTLTTVVIPLDWVFGHGFSDMCADYFYGVTCP